MDKPNARDFILGDYKIPYTVRTSKRAIRYHISIDKEGVEIVLPIGIPPERAESLLNRNSKWVLAHWIRISRKLHHADFSPLPDNTILFRGKPTPIILKPESSLKSRIVVNYLPGKIQVRVPHSMKKIPGKYVYSWLADQARGLIAERVADLSVRYDLHPGQITIRNQKTRWGSCSSSKTLSFNWRMIMLPQEVMDYIVIHELSHMEEPNHSRRFWSLVASRCPEYKIQRSWLKRNSFLLQPGFD
jgi:predicted metal-dependent hydrolase